MTQKRTIKEQLDPIQDWIDLGAISEEMFGRSAALYDKMKDDSFTSQERAQLRGELLRLAERLIAVVEEIEV